MIKKFKQIRSTHFAVLVAVTFGLVAFPAGAVGAPHGDAGGATTTPNNQFTFGDMNSDGRVDGLDIDPFVKTLTGDQSTQDGNSDNPGDMNIDGNVDGLDIDPFVQTLTGSGTSGNEDEQPASAPAPSTLSAAMLVGALTLLRRRRRA